MNVIKSFTNFSKVLTEMKEMCTRVSCLCECRLSRVRTLAMVSNSSRTRVLYAGVVWPGHRISYSMCRWWRAWRSDEGLLVGEWYKNTGSVLAIVHQTLTLLISLCLLALRSNIRNKSTFEQAGTGMDQLYFMFAYSLLYLYINTFGQVALM